MKMKNKIFRSTLFSFLLFTLCLAIRAQEAQSAGRAVLLPDQKLASKLMARDMPYRVIVPVGYDAKPEQRFPVIYLLHGLAGHFTNWTDLTKVTSYAANYNFIIVMPEGNDSWYVDGASGTKYESYILKELLPDVERRYRTIQSRYGRAIAGLSMGGYGAIKFGLKNPSTFAFAGSMSGALAPATWTEDDLKNLKTIYDSLPPVFGAAGSDVRKGSKWAFREIRRTWGRSV